MERRVRPNDGGEALNEGFFSADLTGEALDIRAVRDGHLHSPSMHGRVSHHILILLVEFVGHVNAESPQRIPDEEATVTIAIP